MSIAVEQRKNMNNVFHTCKSCGKSVEKTFQEDMCKDCLHSIFKKLSNVINSIRK